MDVIPFVLLFEILTFQTVWTVPFISKNCTDCTWLGWTECFGGLSHRRTALATWTDCRCLYR